MNMQLNPQLMPAARRRRVGVGAMATVIQPGQAWNITLTVENGATTFFRQSIPAALVPGLSLLGPVAHGQQVISGTYQGATPFTIPATFSYSVTLPNVGTQTVIYPVVAASVSGSPSCPSGMYWNGSACVAIPACPSGYHWDASLNRCVTNGITFTPPPPPPPSYTVVNTPFPTSSGVVTSAGATTYGAGVFTFIPGHRIQSTATASGGAMPPNFTGVTVASLQASADPQQLQYKIISVSYPSPLTMVVIYDYTGPQKTIGSPVTFASGAVTMTTIYTDQGPSPSSGSSLSNKTLYYVAGGTAASRPRVRRNRSVRVRQAAARQLDEQSDRVRRHTDPGWQLRSGHRPVPGGR
jgi:hypothetical protein